MLYIVINVFIGGPLGNQLVEGQPSLKELNMKYNIWGKQQIAGRYNNKDFITVKLYRA